MNNKNIAKIAIWTSIAALAVGVAAIAIAYPRKEAVENSIALLEKISDELREVEVIRLESDPELVNRMKSAAYKTNSEKVISLACHLHPREV